MSSKSFYTLQSITDSERNVFCQLLEIDTYKILINVGSGPSLDVDYQEKLLKIIEEIDCVLICHAELKYIGGLPLLSERFKGKVYCSVPVQTIGKLLVTEVNRNLEIFGRKKYELDEIDECFNKTSPIKYSQAIELGALRISAHNSGHSIGGCLWQIFKDNENVVIAYDINHRKENHVDGLELNNIKKSFLFLMNCDFVGERPISRKNRDLEFVNSLSINSKGKIIVICSFCRYLEICSLLDEFLDRKNKKCTLLSFSSTVLYENLKIMLEWAGDIALKKFTNSKVNPFSFKNIRFKELYTEIDSKTDIFVILDDHLGSVFTNRIIYDLNDEKNVLLLFNDEQERIVQKLDFLEVPEFILEKESSKKSNKNKLKEQKKRDLETESCEREILHKVVCEEPQDAFEENLYVFPVRNKQRPRDMYGEFYDIKMFSEKAEKNEKEFVEETPVAKKTQENITVERRPFSCRIRTKSFNFNGLSDGDSVKTILESLEIEKLILFGANKMFVDFFYHLCYYTRNFKDICILRDQKINLSTDITTTKVNLEENFLERANLRQVNNRQLATFKGFIKDNVIHYEGPLNETLCLGEIKITELRKQLLEKNLRVKKINESVLLIEERIRLVFTEETVRLIGEMDNVYLFVRKIIYGNLCFIN